MNINGSDRVTHGDSGDSGAGAGWCMAATVTLYANKFTCPLAAVRRPHLVITRMKINV